MIDNSGNFIGSYPKFRMVAAPQKKARVRKPQVGAGNFYFCCRSKLQQRHI